jgi:CubicO group peptidase (beta-lactamase class C family)
MLYTSDRYFQYSNLGLTLAGEVVEKTSSKSFEDYVQEAILHPLGLKNTTPFMPEEQREKGLATGYSAINREGVRERQPFYQTRGIAPAAGFASNVRDLAAFASWQFRLLEKGGEEVLKASTLREMQRVHWVDPDWKTTWGLGFRVGQVEDQTLVGHNGACPGYFTALLMNPRKKIAAIVMMNAMNVAAGGMANQMLKIIGPSVEEKKDANKESDENQAPIR